MFTGASNGATVRPSHEVPDGGGIRLGDVSMAQFHSSSVPEGATSPEVRLSESRPGPPRRAGRSRVRGRLRALPRPVSRPRPDPGVTPTGPLYELRGGAYVRVVKPAIDRIGAMVALVALAPLIGAVALGVRFRLGRPVIYRQRRVGLGGGTFEVYKFRTMQEDRRRRQVPVPHERRCSHKTPDDPRHTRFGRLLREWSLDELPQLWNVLRGEMSLVGPRPELVELVARYEPWQHRRHAVKPGLTGLWQVAARGDGPMQLHCDLDLAYVDAVSLRTDLALLARTLPALLARRGH